MWPQGQMACRIGSGATYFPKNNTCLRRKVYNNENETSIFQQLAICLRRKMSNYKKIPSREELQEELMRGAWRLPPLSLEVDFLATPAKDARLDAEVTVTWSGKRYRFGGTLQRLSTPKALRSAAAELSRGADGPPYPLLITSYLAPERLDELARLEVSGIDLCGNGVVIVPGELLVLRSGAPNRYRWEGQIKNIYRGVSSIVARLFLLADALASVGDAQRKIRALGGEVTLPTISKVCKGLEDDLMIERRPGATPRTRSLRVLQPEKLLDSLRAQYVAPTIRRTFQGRFDGASDALVERLLAWRQATGGKVVRTGAGSVDAYAVMARHPLESFYCSNLASLRAFLAGALVETERFPTIHLLETTDDLVYFDSRSGLVASPVQTYLELAAGDKRDQETSAQVRQLILSPTAKSATPETS
jgi:hypothetical protein